MLKLAHHKPEGSSRDQIDIESINNGILKLTGNRYRVVLKTGSINFELKSEEEQDSLIDIYESFLNSIGFNIQLLIRTREIDIDDYLKDLSQKISLEQTTIYRKQLKNYHKFISSLVSSNKILNRQFYIVIPIDLPKKTDTSVVRDQLNLRSDIITKNLARLGINSRLLDSIEVIDLFYSFYSPEQAKIQPISETAFEVINSEFVEREKKHAKT